MDNTVSRVFLSVVKTEFGLERWSLSLAFSPMWIDYTVRRVFLSGVKKTICREIDYINNSRPYLPDHSLSPKALTCVVCVDQVGNSSPAMLTVTPGLLIQQSYLSSLRVQNLSSRRHQCEISTEAPEILCRKTCKRPLQSWHGAP